MERQTFEIVDPGVVTEGVSAVADSGVLGFTGSLLILGAGVYSMWKLSLQIWPQEEDAGDRPSAPASVPDAPPRFSYQSYEPEFYEDAMTELVHETPELSPELPPEVEQLRDCTLARVWGDQGAGKTTILKWLYQERKALGHKIVVIDPHDAKGKWPQKAFGSRKNYDEISGALSDFLRLVDERYDEYYEKGEDHVFQPVTYFCEELTGYADRVDKNILTEFTRTIVADIRKIGLKVVIIPHDDTNTANGGTQGLWKTLNKQVLDFEALSIPDGKGGRMPKGQAYFTPSGKLSSDEKRLITLPDFRALLKATPKAPAKPDPLNIDSLPMQEQFALRQATEAALKQHNGAKWKAVETIFGLTKGSDPKRKAAADYVQAIKDSVEVAG